MPFCWVGEQQQLPNLNHSACVETPGGAKEKSLMAQGLNETITRDCSYWCVIIALSCSKPPMRTVTPVVKEASNAESITSIKHQKTGRTRVVAKNVEVSAT